MHPLWEKSLVDVSTCGCWWRLCSGNRALSVNQHRHSCSQSLFDCSHLHPQFSFGYSHRCVHVHWFLSATDFKTDANYVLPFFFTEPSLIVVTIIPSPCLVIVIAFLWYFLDLFCTCSSDSPLVLPFRYSHVIFVFVLAYSLLCTLFCPDVEREISTFFIWLVSRKSLPIRW